MAGEDGYRVTLYQLAGPLACPPLHPLGVTLTRGGVAGVFLFSTRFYSLECDFA
jgi:hypothetical protein